jgi:hypothetical protein
MAPWVIIPCSGLKRVGAVLPAGDRYVGSLHLLARRAAEALTSPDRIRIASARYGLLALSDPTEPYDRQVGDKLGADDLRQLHGRVHGGAVDMLNLDRVARGERPYSGSFDMEPVVALVPAGYVELLSTSPLLARHLVAPLAGCGGIGVMRHLLAGIRDTGQLDTGMLAPVDR